MKIPMSFVPAADPTTVGNFYQTHIGGRGYGFHYTAFQNLDAVKKDFTTKW